MSEIADELERWASVFHERARVLYSSEDTTGAALMAVVDTLQHRAAELRRQGSAPTYASQPKPASFAPGQRWECIERYRYEVESTSRTSAGTELVHWRDGGFSRASDLLSDPDCVYLGDGPEPAR